MPTLIRCWIRLWVVSCLLLQPGLPNASCARRLSAKSQTKSAMACSDFQEQALALRAMAPLHAIPRVWVTRIVIGLVGVSAAHRLFHISFIDGLSLTMSIIAAALSTSDPNWSGI